MGSPRRVRGFTLIELMIVVALIAVLSVLAVPAFQKMVRASRTIALTNELVAALSLARSEAVRRGMPVQVCASSNGGDCTGAWNQGWIVWADLNNDSNVDGGEVLRVFTSAKGNPSITAKQDKSGGADITAVSYQPLGLIESGEALVFRLWLNNCQGQEKREIKVSLGGRINTTKISCT